MNQIPKELILEVDQQVEINAPIEKAFDALLTQLQMKEGPKHEDLKAKIEPWPGGRWYRDLDGNNGHLWGHVQVIKRPDLLEITGPMFMSYPAVSHLQFRLTKAAKQTILTLRHRALGLIQPEHREGVVQGWANFLKGAKSHAERA